MNVAVSQRDADRFSGFTVTAIDCNGISSVTQTVGTWPVVLITAPMDRRLGRTINPYAYTVTNATSNPIRALVFDPAAVTQVQFRVNGGTWQPMASVSGNPRLWQGVWDASILPEGEHTVDVQATTGSGVRTDTVTTYVKSQVLPKIGVTELVIGKYVTSGSGKNKTTVFSYPVTTFTRGETVVIRATVKDSLGKPLANATVQLAVSGASSVSLTSGLSNRDGIAEAKWTTTAPRRGQGGTPVGGYASTVTNVTATGYQWDNSASSVSFKIQ